MELKGKIRRGMGWDVLVVLWISKPGLLNCLPGFPPPIGSARNPCTSLRFPGVSPL